MVFGIGPAGTGKTYLAVAMAISALLAKRVNRIILARPAVEAGERLGFLPGTLQDKIDPYLRPLYDALYDMLDPEKVDRYLEKNVIEIAPIAFMRGRTLNDSFVILDEAQNTTSEQMATSRRLICQVRGAADCSKQLMFSRKSKVSHSYTSTRATWCGITWCSVLFVPTTSTKLAWRKNRCYCLMPRLTPMGRPTGMGKVRSRRRRPSCRCQEKARFEIKVMRVLQEGARRPSSLFWVSSWWDIPIIQYARGGRRKSW